MLLAVLKLPVYTRLSSKMTKICLSLPSKVVCSLTPTQKWTLCLNMLNGTIYSLIHEPSLPCLQYADFAATSKQSKKKKPKVSHVSESTIVTHRKVFSEHIIYYFKLPVLLYIFLMRHDKYRIFTTLHITRFQFFSICIRHLIPMLRLSISFSHYKIYSF